MLLFDTFAACKQLLRQDPQQAEERAQVRELLNVNSGGIIFTTVQKFSIDDSLPPSGGNQRGHTQKLAIAPISSYLPTKPTAANTDLKPHKLMSLMKQETSSVNAPNTALPNIFAMPYPVLPLSALQVHPSSKPTKTPLPFLATISTSTTSPKPSKMAQLSRFITKAA